MSEHRHQVDKSDRNQSEHKTSNFPYIHAQILAHLSFLKTLILEHTSEKDTFNLA